MSKLCTPTIGKLKLLNNFFKILLFNSKKMRSSRITHQPPCSRHANERARRRVSLCLIQSHSSVSFLFFPSPPTTHPPGCAYCLVFTPSRLARRQLRVVEFLPRAHMRKWNRLKCEFVLWRRSINGNGAAAGRETRAHI